MNEEFDRLKAQKDAIVQRGAKKIFDEGFLAGIAAERERVQPLVNAVSDHLNGRVFDGIERRENLKKALDAYTTSQNDAKDRGPK